MPIDLQGTDPIDQHQHPMVDDLLERPDHTSPAFETDKLSTPFHQVKMYAAETGTLSRYILTQMA
jgi:hypothetical protein